MLVLAPDFAHFTPINHGQAIVTNTDFAKFALLLDAIPSSTIAPLPLVPHPQ